MAEARHAPTALEALPDDAGDLLLPAARAAIADELGAPPPALTAPGLTAPGLDVPPGWALEPGASYVTLTKDGRLRGCTGTLVARRPLLEDVRANAVATALHDRRFLPMVAEEVPLVVVEVSVLSPLRALAASSLAEAYEELRPGVDGVLVEAGPWNRATFLPQMWDSLPTPQVFLEHLWVKAGLAPGVWHGGTRLRTYAARAWREAREGS